MKKIIKTKNFEEGIEVMVDDDKYPTFIPLEKIEKLLRSHEPPLLEMSYRQHWKDHKSSWHAYGSKTGIRYTILNLHSLLNILFNEQKCERVEIILKRSSKE